MKAMNAGSPHPVIFSSPPWFRDPFTASLRPFSTSSDVLSFLDSYFSLVDLEKLPRQPANPNFSVFLCKDKEVVPEKISTDDPRFSEFRSFLGFSSRLQTVFLNCYHPDAMENEDAVKNWGFPWSCKVVVPFLIS